MAEEDTRTLRELAAPNLNLQPLCITMPKIEGNASFELRSGLIHFLPSCHGLAGEEPHKHLQEFDVVCSSMKPPMVTEEQVKLRAFPFSLKDAAKEWLFFLPAGSVTTWRDMKMKFLKKYFPASRAATLRKEIYGIKQQQRETLHEYLERFNRLCARCPQHQITNQLLLQYFYEGLGMQDRNNIDAASQGALADKTPKAAWELIARMEENSQQFGTRGVEYSEGNDSLRQQISELTKFVHQLATGNTRHVKTCGICTSPEHHTDACPTLHEDSHADVKPAGMEIHTIKGSCHKHLRNNLPPSKSNTSLEEMMKTMAANTIQFQQDTRASIQNLESRVEQIVADLCHVKERETGKWPSQPERNPKNVSAMTLRTGKMVGAPEPIIPKDKDESTIEKGIKKEDAKKNEVIDKTVTKLNTNLAHFPSRLAKPIKPKRDNEILEFFRKVELNIPLLDAIHQIPKYAKFLKELCTNKRKLKGDECIIASENVSALLQRKIPPKCGDPGMFTIPCKIGQLEVKHAMLDLGAAINVMPKSIYNCLNLAPLKKTGIIIQLANRTHAYSEGIIEDVLVQVNELIFPVDFYVLEMHDEHSPNPSPLLLGRPFMCTADTKIDVKNGILTMEFDGEKIEFKIFDAIKYPLDPHSVFSLDVIDL
ncbi:uncharacterized protein LOC127263641 [Andrographis paniculata]|uniref:uncharacterized protein LOC127263641 n=1 Tax=Andrographis paniculata TaxID=175694 RepID=UPI0021E7B8DF|nr:uncharacterized protein LOC127263641 [Andrographis paniculata]